MQAKPLPGPDAGRSIRLQAGSHRGRIRTSGFPATYSHTPSSRPERSEEPGSPDAATDAAPAPEIPDNHNAVSRMTTRGVRGGNSLVGACSQAKPLPEPDAGRSIRLRAGSHRGRIGASGFPAAYSHTPSSRPERNGEPGSPDAATGVGRSRVIPDNRCAVSGMTTEGVRGGSILVGACLQAKPLPEPDVGRSIRLRAGSHRGRIRTSGFPAAYSHTPSSRPQRSGEPGSPDAATAAAPAPGRAGVRACGRAGVRACGRAGRYTKEGLPQAAPRSTASSGLQAVEQGLGVRPLRERLVRLQ